MLHEFLTANRTELVALCKSKVALRREFVAGDAQLESGIPRFIDQLIDTLETENADPLRSREISGHAGGRFASSEIDTTAAIHGRDLLGHGYPVEQVVHDYGDLCQAITELASHGGIAIEVDEFRTLNRCLDNAIAGAVKAFGKQHDFILSGRGVRDSNERLGFLAHDLRNHIHTASLAVAALKSGYVGASGATAGILDRSLLGMRALIDRALAEVRATAGLPARPEVISLAGFIAEAETTASLDARGWECELSVAPVDPALGIEVDPDLFTAALANLLQNAFKFTHPGSKVSLRGYAVDDRILIDVEDCCGGLPAGSAEHLFGTFSQHGTDRSGLGLGLAICKRTVDMSNGTLSVRDLPGKGCVFTIDLPRRSSSAPVASPQPRQA